MTGPQLGQWADPAVPAVGFGRASTLDREADLELSLGHHQRAEALSRIASALRGEE